MARPESRPLVDPARRQHGLAITRPSAREQEAEKGALHGLAAWKALAGKCGYINETRAACCEELGTAKMNQGQETEGVFFKMDDLRTRLHGMEDLMPVERHDGIIMQAITYDHNNYEPGGIKSTMTNMFVDSFLRSYRTKCIAGRYVAMQATNDLLSGVQR